MMGNKIVHRIFILSMLLCIFVPGMLFFVRQLDNGTEVSKVPPSFSAVFSEVENGRTLYRNLESYVDAFDVYFSEHFGLRNELFAWYGILKRKIFGTQVLPNKVIEGHNDWMFLGNDFSNTIRELMGLSLFSHDELHNLEARLAVLTEFLNEQKTSLLVVVVPDKSTIYAENVGWRFKQVAGKKAQLIELLRAKNINHIDLTKLLKNASSRTYYKTDSHWNSYGAMLSGLHILNSDDFFFTTPPSADSFQPKDTVFAQMDLTKMLMMHIPEKSAYYVYNSESHAVELSGMSDDIGFEGGVDTRERHYTNDSQKIKVSIMGDSFCEGLIPYVKEYCGELHIFARQKFDKKFVEKYPSDVLILQVAERNIDKFIDNYWSVAR